MRRPVVAAILASLLIAQLALGATSDGPSPPTNEPGDSIEFVPGQPSVKQGPTLSTPSQQATFAATNGLRELSRTSGLGWIRFQITDRMSETQKATALRANPLVVNAIPITRAV